VKPDLDDVVFPESLPSGGTEAPPQDIGVVFEVPLGQHANPLRCIELKAKRISGCRLGFRSGASHASRLRVASGVF
jgi:hypothetical protein